MWKSKKNNNRYLVTGKRINKTNIQDGQVMVEYEKENHELSDMKFVREEQEFLEKFERCVAMGAALPKATWESSAYALLRRYEQWEGKLLSSDYESVIDTMNDSEYNMLLDLQAERNRLVDEFERSNQNG